MSEKCPHCGRLLFGVAFKCPQCNNWVKDFYFTQHGDEDDNFIKNPKGEVSVGTPTFLAVMLINLMADTDIRKTKSMQQLIGHQLEKKQQLNLLVFQSFCYFNAIRLHAWIKRGCRKTIEGQLKDALLNGVIASFGCEIYGVEYEESTPILRIEGGALYNRFEDISKDMLNGMFPQASMALASAVFGEKQADILKGAFLGDLLMNLTFDLREPFGEMFLVEEKDYNWQAIPKDYTKHQWVEKLWRAWKNGHAP